MCYLNNLFNKPHQLGIELIHPNSVVNIYFKWFLPADNPKSMKVWSISLQAVYQISMYFMIMAYSFLDIYLHS